ncbi:MAG: NAD(P)-binding domain-containing protein, partial [Alphaproteobacteria bacterium]|nr:NAD(P)-binding domain-containing protein [Alphaproteobacteria bacterium]
MKIGFIGLGNVGAKLAGSLLRHGIDTTVRDIERRAAEPLIEQGAKWADTAKELAEGSDIIITCLPSPAVSADVMEADDGVIAGLSDGKIWL